jgi:TrbL/VirB6 plasmid conjugal transfer protein
MLRVLLALIVAVALTGHARAQTEPAVQLGNFATPPEAVAAPAGSLAIFTVIFEAVDTPIQGAAGPMVTAAAAQTRTWLTAGLTLWLAFWCIGAMFPDGSGGSMFFTGLFRELLQGAVALTVIQIYADVVLPFALTAFPGELANLFTFGGTPKVGVSVAANYDAVWNAVRDLYVVVNDRVPDSIAPKIVLLMAALALLKFIGFVFIMWAFFIYLGTHTVEVVLVIIGVLFCGMAAIPTLRKYAWGWLSALLATICTTALLSLVLGLMLGVVTNESKTLSALPENTAIGDQLDGFAGVIGCLFLLGSIVTVMPFVGLAIFGGVQNTTTSLTAAAGAAGRIAATSGRKLAGALK